MITIDVIPVPPGYSVEDAWTEIEVFGRLVRPRWRNWSDRLTRRTKWAIIEEEDEDDTDD